MNSEAQLREHFQQMRREDHVEAPAWNPDVLQAPRSAARRGLSPWLTWAPVAAAVVLMLAWGTSVFESAPVPEKPRLAESLPVLMDAPPAVLFASLEDSFADLPSDALLPAHLTISMP